MIANNIEVTYCFETLAFGEFLYFFHFFLLTCCWPFFCFITKENIVHVLHGEGIQSLGFDSFGDNIPFCHSFRLKPICFIQDFQQTLIDLLCYDNITGKVFTNFNMSFKIVKVAMVFEIVAFNTTWSDLSLVHLLTSTLISSSNFSTIYLFCNFSCSQWAKYCFVDSTHSQGFILFYFIFLFKVNRLGWYLLSFVQFIWPTWAIWIITRTWFKGHGLWLIHFPFALEFVEIFFHTWTWFGRWTLCSLLQTHVFRLFLVKVMISIKIKPEPSLEVANFVALSIMISTFVPWFQGFFSWLQQCFPLPNPLVQSHALILIEMHFCSSFTLLCHWVCALPNS